MNLDSQIWIHKRTGELIEVTPLYQMGPVCINDKTGIMMINFGWFILRSESKGAVVVNKTWQIDFEPMGIL